MLGPVRSARLRVLAVVAVGLLAATQLVSPAAAAGDPGIVFTHRAEDMHQDHRLVCELARHTFRNSLILEYEIPKFEGDLGQPNFFVHTDERLCEQKIGYVTKFFPSQRDKHWFTEDTFWSLMRIRGIESKSPSGHAEAFHCRKLVVG